MDLSAIGLDRGTTEALLRSGFQNLSPSGKSYLERRLRSGAGAGLNPAGIRALGYGCARAPEGLVGAEDGRGAAPFDTVDAAALAAVQIAYRAAPRRWAEVGGAEAVALDTYPTLERVSVMAEDVYPGLDAEALGPMLLGVAVDGRLLALHVPPGATGWRDAVDGVPVTSPLTTGGRPSPAAEETFRKLAGDWEAFDRMGVGAAVVPSLVEDAVAWRGARDAWLAGVIDVATIGDVLTKEVDRARKVRRALVDVGAVDLGDSPTGVDHEQGLTVLGVLSGVVAFAVLGLCAYAVLDRARRPADPGPVLSGGGGASWVRVSPRAGTVVGNWRLKKKLGAGGMGSVWAAENVDTGMSAAVKLMAPQYARDPENFGDMIRESAVSNTVDVAAHVPLPTGPGSVHVYDVGRSESGLPFLVMDKLQGRSLDRIQDDRGRLPARVVTPILDSMLYTLSHAHDRGIVHRDLKPANVFLTSAGDVKVLDYGLAKLPGDRPAGGFVGTPGFVPPEQAAGLDVGPPADVFGAGATAYALLTGRAPVRSRGYRVGMVGVDPVPPVRSVAPDTPVHLAKVIDRALSADPRSRYADAGKMREALRESGTLLTAVAPAVTRALAEGRSKGNVVPLRRPVVAAGDVQSLRQVAGGDAAGGDAEVDDLLDAIREGIRRGSLDGDAPATCAPVGAGSASGISIAQVAEEEPVRTSSAVEPGGEAAGPSRQTTEDLRAELPTLRDLDGRLRDVRDAGSGTTIEARVARLHERRPDLRANGSVVTGGAVGGDPGRWTVDGAPVDVVPWAPSFDTSGAASSTED